MARPSPWCAKVAMAGQPPEAKSPPRRCEHEGCLGWSTPGACVVVGNACLQYRRGSLWSKRETNTHFGVIGPRYPTLGVPRLPWLFNLLRAHSGLVPAVAGQPAAGLLGLQVPALGMLRLPWLVNLLRAWASWLNPGCDPHLEAPISRGTIHLKEFRVPEQQVPEAATLQILCQDCVHLVGESLAKILSPSSQSLQCCNATVLAVLISLPGNNHQCRVCRRGAMRYRRRMVVCHRRRRA